MPHIMDLIQFFEAYDVFDDRVFEHWELQEIFPNLNNRDLEDISKQFHSWYRSGPRLGMD